MKSVLTIIIVWMLSSAAYAAAISNAHRYGEDLPNKTEETPEEPKTPQYITVLVEKVEGELEAKITSLSEQAQDIGLTNMRLRGAVHEKQKDNGKKEVNITWHNVALSGKKEPITRPYTSRLLMTGELKEGMEFKAEGDPSTLLQAWQKLQLDDKLKEESSFESDNKRKKDNSNSSSLSSGQLNNANPDLASDPLQTEIAKDPIILTTAEGCTINVDIAQRVAIVQERTLQDGEEIAGCSDSFTRYPILEDYSSCPVHIDLAEGKVFEQYTLGYEDNTTGGRVEVFGCTPSLDRFVAIQETAEGCTDKVGTDIVTGRTRLFYDLRGIQTTVQECQITDVTYDVVTTTSECSIRHDFSTNQSIQQVRSYYVKDGQRIEISSCEDDLTDTYDHTLTRDTCSPVIGDSVVFQERKYITVDGSRVYVSECAPNPETTASIVEEDCLSPAYTHDFDTGQSYVNKNYSYNDGSKTVSIASCVQSEETLTHYVDTGVCEDTHDDVLKQTLLYGRTFISTSNSATAPESSRIYISSCQQIGSPVPYTDSGSSWAVNYSALSHLLIEDSKCTYEDNENWVTTSGITIDRANSDAAPAFSITGYDWLYKCWSRFVVDASCTNCNVYKDMPCSYDGYPGKSEPVTQGRSYCATPTCTVTTLLEHPTYSRLDGTVFKDTSIVLSQTQVCGNGSKLTGVGE